jgi:hypothetical protein
MAGQKGEQLKPLQEQYLAGMTQAQQDYLNQLKERETRYQAEA